VKIVDGKALYSVTLENVHSFTRIKNIRNIVHVGFGGGIAMPEVEMSFDEFNKIPDKDVYFDGTNLYVMRNGVLFYSSLEIGDYEPENVIKNPDGSYTFSKSFDVVTVRGHKVLEIYLCMDSLLLGLLGIIITFLTLIYYSGTKDENLENEDIRWFY
jgi:hypothetical protein